MRLIACLLIITVTKSFALNTDNKNVSSAAEVIIELLNNTETEINKAEFLRKTFSEGDNTFLTKNKTYCVCVPYHLCNEIAVAVYGEGLLDIRIQKNPCPSPGEICCTLKNNPENNSTYIQHVAKCGYQSDKELKSSQALLGTTTDDTVTKFGEYPWTALVYANFQYVCTGSLVHPKVVLTSATCIESHTHQYTVRMGEWDSTHIKEPLGYENRNVVQILKHPKFNDNTLYYNAALLIVDFPYILQANIRTICLIDELATSLTQSNNICVATGWGKNTTTGRFRKKMKKITFSLLPRKVCQSRLRNSHLGMSFSLHKSFLCATNDQYYDICVGDYGGPLVSPITEHSVRFQQIAITSWNIDCFANYPTVFTKVAYVRDWIDGEFDNLGLDTKYYTNN